MKHGLIKTGSTDGTGTEVDAMKLKRKSSIFYRCVFHNKFFSMATKKMPWEDPDPEQLLIALLDPDPLFRTDYGSADPDLK